MLSGYVLPWPAENPTGVFGAGDSGAVIVNLLANVIERQLPESLHSPWCSWGVGPSVFPGHAVLYGRQSPTSCGLPVSWEIGPPLVRGDTLWGFPSTWSLAELGKRRSLASSDSWLYLVNCEAQPCQFESLFGDGAVTGVTFSPRGDLAALDQGGGRPPFVIDPRVPSRSFTLSGIRYARAATFSHGGDTLFVAGVDTSYAGSTVLTAFDARTGAVLRSRSLDSLFPLRCFPKGLALDPMERWLYVAVDLGSVTPQGSALLVIDTQTFEVIGVLRTPLEKAPFFDGFERVIPMPHLGLIYVVATWQGYDVRGARARIMRYDRLRPEPATP
jgi:hypothetical protein